MADERIPELVADLETHTAELLARELNIPKELAVMAGKKLSRHLTDNWGGQLIYIPKNHGGRLDERDRQIYAEFDGRNHQQLAKKYGLAVQQVYKIIKLARQADAAARQGGLFGDGMDDGR